MFLLVLYSNKYTCCICAVVIRHIHLFMDKNLLRFCDSRLLQYSKQILILNQTRKKVFAPLK